MTRTEVEAESVLRFPGKKEISPPNFENIDQTPMELFELREEVEANLAGR